MKKDLTNFLKIIFTVFLCQNIAFGETFILPDWNNRPFDTKSKTLKTYNLKTFEQVRDNQQLNKFFDKQIIKVYPNKKTSPQEAGKEYLSKTLSGDKSSETYILKNEKNSFKAVFCSNNLQRCEIIRFYNGFNGLIEIKYVHNNLWHFQNHIGSFIEFQNRIISFPSYKMTDKLYKNEAMVRL